MQKSTCLTVIILLTLAGPLSAYSVLWDTSHGVFADYEPTGNYSPLIQALQSNDFTVTVTRGGFLTDDPEGYDVIVVCLPTAWYSSYTSAEVDRITDFVNSGGGLLITSDNTNCPNQHVQPVASAFGVTVGVSYIDPYDLYFTEFADHPLFDGISRIYMRAAGEISAVLPSKEVAWQNGTENALITVGTYGNGRVVALGENAFLGSYLHIEDNEQFSINVFQYLANPGDQCTAPDEPSEPEPVDGATGVPLDTLLSWNGYTSEPEQSLAASALAGVEVDDTGAMVGAQMAAYAQTAQTTSAKNILYFWEHSYTTLQRLEDLGYSVTQTTDPGDLTRANLQNYDLLWIDFAVSPLSYASQASDIQQWVSLDGGGLLVVQPGITGAQVTVFPGGFDVTIESQGWSFDRVDCAIVNHSHPIVQGLTDLDLSGNYDTVRQHDIGGAWDIIAVSQGMPTDVTLLAGEYGTGRLCFSTGNYIYAAHDPGSDQFVIQMVNWVGGSAGGVSQTTYDVYFGTDPNALALVDGGSGISDSYCNPAPEPNDLLDDGTQYYWQVVAVNDCGSTAGTVWSFTTEAMPIADAGPDQAIYTGVDGFAQMQLDGSASYDPDGDELTYRWTWQIDGQDYDANGVDPLIELPEGEHTVKLVVYDGSLYSEPDNVAVRVLTRIEAVTFVVPSVLNLTSSGKFVMAIMYLPEGIAKGDVKNTLFALYVDGAGGDGIPADFQQVVAAGNKRRVFARFDRAALIAALGDSTVANLRVAGQLQSGQYIYGEDTIRIVKARRRLPQAPRGQGSTTQRAPRRSVR